VNLTVTDHAEQTSSKTIQVTIEAYAEAEVAVNSKSSSLSYTSIALLFAGCIIGLGLEILLRKKNIHKEQKPIKSVYTSMGKINMPKEQKPIQPVHMSIEEQIDQLLSQKYKK
jgi:hypothetical protein